MENPAPWGKAERVITNALMDWAAARDASVIGPSQARLIADALREAGLLKEEMTPNTPATRAVDEFLNHPEMGERGRFRPERPTT